MWNMLRRGRLEETAVSVGRSLRSDSSSQGLGCFPCRIGALASFAGHICKASADVELSALLQYLTNQLRSVEGNDLPVLRELISVMTVRSGLRAWTQPRASERASPPPGGYHCEEES